MSAKAFANDTESIRYSKQASADVFMCLSAMSFALPTLTSCCGPFLPGSRLASMAGRALGLELPASLTSSFNLLDPLCLFLHLKNRDDRLLYRLSHGLSDTW